MCGPEEEKRDRYRDREQIRMVEDAEKGEREGETSQMSPLLDSMICSSSLASSPVEAHHPSPVGLIDLERAQKDRSRPAGNRKVFAEIVKFFYVTFGDVGFSRVFKTCTFYMWLLFSGYSIYTHNKLATLCEERYII